MTVPTNDKIYIHIHLSQPKGWHVQAFLFFCLFVRMVEKKKKMKIKEIQRKDTKGILGRPKKVEYPIFIQKR